MTILKQAILHKLFLAMMILTAAGCAQHPSGTDIVATSTFLPPVVSSGSVKIPISIGVVALGPNQFLRQEWFEFDPAFKAHFASSGTHTTVLPARLDRTRLALGDAFRQTVISYGDVLKNSGEFAGHALLLAPGAIAIGTLFQSTVGQLEWEQPRPIETPLDDIDWLASASLKNLLDKHRLTQAIGERLLSYSDSRTGYNFQKVTFENARERSTTITPQNNLLTLRVQSVGLTSDHTDDPNVALTINVWANLNSNASRPFDYRGNEIEMSILAANDALRLHQEVDHAVEEIARRIIGEKPRRAVDQPKFIPKVRDVDRQVYLSQYE